MIIRCVDCRTTWDNLTQDPDCGDQINHDWYAPRQDNPDIHAEGPSATVRDVETEGSITVRAWGAPS